jgi:uncharacterized protein
MKMTTFSGRRIDPLNLQPGDINIEDIAHSLSLLCRFGGHTTSFYSVAQHSVRVARALPPELWLEALLHDATETYLQDLIRPIKRQLPQYSVLEQRVWNTLAFRYNLNSHLSSEIIYVDNACLKSEIAQFLPSPGREEELANSYWDEFEALPPADHSWSPGEAEGYFLMLYVEATAYRGSWYETGRQACYDCTNSACSIDCTYLKVPRIN